MVKLRRRKAPAPLSYWEVEVFEVYDTARRAAECGRVHPRTLERNGGTPRSYAEYHARRYALEILRTSFTDEDGDRFDRIWHQRKKKRGVLAIDGIPA